MKGDSETSGTDPARSPRGLTSDAAARERMLTPSGSRDRTSVTQGGVRAIPPKISGVRVIELGNVLTRSGLLTEVFRSDFPGIEIVPKQVNWVELGPNGVTDWHRHTRQTDHLIGVGGVIKLVLWDGRSSSSTHGETEAIRFGVLRPAIVIVPPGVWHGLRNESGQPSGYLNVIDELYDYENPDNWRLSSGAAEAPDIL